MNENLKEPRPKSELKPDLKKGTNIEDGIGKEGTTDKKEPDKEPLKPDTKVRKTRTKEEPKPVRNQKPTPKRTKPKPLQPDGTLKLKDYLKLKSAARNEKFQLGKLSVSDAECVENSLQGKTTEARKASGIE